MTKSDLAVKIAEISGIEKKTVEHILNVERDVIIETLQSGEDIFSRGFGTFTIKERAARKARNISAGTVIDVPAKKVVKFKSSFTSDRRG